MEPYHASTTIAKILATSLNDNQTTTNRIYDCINNNHNKKEEYVTTPNTH